jgi:DeoR/GlpR family transcriptional regulator of sugar metabolism
MPTRHQDIVDFVQQQRKVSTAELASRFGVSEVTIRQDLNKLEKMGFIKRLHGAAVPNESDSLARRLQQNYSEKLKIARAAAADVEAGENVLVEGGSTNALLARQLAERGDVTIVTASAFIAHELRDSDADVILLGGRYQHESESMVGPLTRMGIRNTPFHQAFVGVDGIDLRQGLTSRDVARADVVQSIADKLGKVNVLTTPNKFNQLSNHQSLRLDQVDRLYTSQALDETTREALQQAGISLRLV